VAKQKEFDLTLTLRSANPIKTKKFQALIDEMLSTGTEGIDIEDGFEVVNVIASDVRKVGEPELDADTPETNELDTAVENSYDPFGVAGSVGGSSS
jgi:hypothetical protein